MRWTAFVAALICAAGLSGCNYIDPPLIFGKVDNFGASASATAPDQGASVNLGYRSAKIAIVPVTAHDATGTVVNVNAGQVSATQKSNEAYSTFAHFEASAGATAKACLGDTFATGYAARTISQNLPNVCK
jgi:hypothetical protein